MNPDAALKALAEPHRRAILRLVAGDPRSVGEIASHLDITGQAVSRHLKVLHEAGLVDERREGTRHLFVVSKARWQTLATRLRTESRSVSDQFETGVDLPAPIEEVFRHLTDPAAMVRWMGQHATLDPATGGVFEIDINGVPVRGRYLEIDPPRRVVVSWGVAGSTDLPPGSTRVEFTLTPTTSGTHLHLVHCNLPASQAPMHATGWKHFLDRLALAATGADPGPDPWNLAPRR